MKGPGAGTADKGHQRDNPAAYPRAGVGCYGTGSATDSVTSVAEELSYEKAREELTGVVKRLEAGGLALEQSIELWERGEKLAAICAEWLDGARARLTAVMASREAEEEPGKAPEAPF